MELTKQKAKENLVRLIAKYQKVVQEDKVQDYNEEATKTAFIQPLLKDVLGWDVNDYNEVSPEERISRGRVDYCLKIDNKPKIFVEAKPLKAELSRHIEQAVRYGYNRKGVPFVLLTDFEEIKLFDVTLKPDIKNPKKGLKLDLYWKWYEDNFDKLWQLSKESVISGELDKLLLAKPKDRKPVDKAILDDLELWRETLAKDIYKNNPNLFNIEGCDPSKGSHPLLGNADYLKEITQRILDRIIFMRFCEDRQFVHGQTLRELFEDRTEQVGTTTMVFLSPKFKQFDITFDSDLFSHKEWENDLQIDFRVMNKIVLDTYNPYQFDVIPLEVLGNIYEQYLGYTIRLTPQMVKYELKPEVRKAGGVYYTPEYIVDYIVKNTVGKILKERFAGVAPPKRAGLSGVRPLRILDPACGSGSFLIRAYEEMLNYYREQKKRLKPQINTDVHRLKSSPLTGEEKGEGESFSLSLRGAERRGNLTQDPIQKELDLKHEDIEPRLSIQEKAEILKNHIYGVDIDEQAVEVTKLSLMLKMLEGEFGIIPGRNILPMLDKNIRCGNSLISGSAIELKKYFGDDYYKVKPFNWEEEFKDVFKDGGFDIVIGNPPYIQLSMNENLSNELKQYLITRYSSSMGRLNTFGFFVKHGINLLNKNAYLGYIIPNTLLTQDYYKELRNMILETCAIKNIVSFGDLPFKDAVVENIILILQTISTQSKRDSNKVAIQKVNKLMQFVTDNFITQGLFRSFNATSFNVNINEKLFLLKEKIENITNKLVQFFDINQAIALKHDRAQYLEQKRINEQYKPVLDGRDINRYSINWNRIYLQYDIKAIHSCKREDIFLSKEKLFFRRVGDRLTATYDDKQFYALNTLVVMNLKENISCDIKFFLALFNSSVLNFYYHTFLKSTKKVFSEIQARQVAQLPIKNINLNKTSDKKQHNNLVSLVDVMLDLNKKIQTAKGNAKDQIQREIDKTDKEIDEIVYKLYNITEQEKKIIEKGG